MNKEFKPKSSIFSLFPDPEGLQRVLDKLRIEGEEFIKKYQEKDKNGNYVVLEELRKKGEEYLAIYRKKAEEIGI